MTVTSNESLLTACPLSTLTVIVAVPPWPAARVMLTVRLEPLPPKTMLEFATSVGFEEVAVSTKEFTGTVASPIVKLMGPVELLLLTMTSGIEEINGGTMVLIHAARVLAALTSMRFRASGGILIVLVVLTRKYITELER